MLCGGSPGQIRSRSVDCYVGRNNSQSESELMEDRIITHLLTCKVCVHAVSTISSKHLSFISAIFCKKQSKHYYLNFFLPTVCHLFTLKSHFTAKYFARFPVFTVKIYVFFFFFLASV